jgi:hypothetical protein
MKRNNRAKKQKVLFFSTQKGVGLSRELTFSVLSSGSRGQGGGSPGVGLSRELTFPVLSSGSRGQGGGSPFALGEQDKRSKAECYFTE